MRRDVATEWRLPSRRRTRTLLAAFAALSASAIAWVAAAGGAPAGAVTPGTVEAIFRSQGLPLIQVLAFSGGGAGSAAVVYKPRSAAAPLYVFVFRTTALARDYVRRRNAAPPARTEVARRARNVVVIHPRRLAAAVREVLAAALRQVAR